MDWFSQIEIFLTKLTFGSPIILPKPKIPNGKFVHYLFKNVQKNMPFFASKVNE